MPVIVVNDDLSLAEAEQQLRDQLAADGVDGNDHVKVEDSPEGRRVEVNIKKTETNGAPRIAQNASSTRSGPVLDRVGGPGFTRGPA